MAVSGSGFKTCGEAFRPALAGLKPSRTSVLKPVVVTTRNCWLELATSRSSPRSRAAYPIRLAGAAVVGIIARTARGFRHGSGRSNSMKQPAHLARAVLVVVLVNAVVA